MRGEGGKGPREWMEMERKEEKVNRRKINGKGCGGKMVIRNS